MALIFLGSWFAQSVTGWSAYKQEQLDHHLQTIGWLSYVGNPQFGSFAVFAIYLRQRGSPESKPVGAAHTDTGLEG